MWLSTRSPEKEILDNSDIDSAELFRNLAELDIINRFLGGYNCSLIGFKTILKTNSHIRTLLDVGFGGGDAIKQLAHFAVRNRRDIFFYGVDYKTDCLNYAGSNLESLKNKLLICDDYKNLSAEFLSKVDVLHCSLFLHHLSNDEISTFFKLARVNNCVLLVNDLHRNVVAYYSIKFLTSVFSRSRLVRNDAPVSVKRGFRKKELIGLLESAGFTHYVVKWTWAFRFMVIAWR